MSEPIRVVVADDGEWFRSLMVQELRQIGFDVVGEAGDAGGALDAVRTHAPDVAVIDVRMPPGRGDEGIEVAKAIRAAGLTTGVLLITAQPDVAAATEFLASCDGGVGYWLKDSIGATGAELADAIRRIDAGEPAIDPAICEELMGRPRKSDLLGALTPTELRTLALMAAGLSNKAIASELIVSLRSVESYIGSIFTKLGLERADDVHRRVIAVLIFLRHLH